MSEDKEIMGAIKYLLANKEDIRHKLKASVIRIEMREGEEEKMEVVCVASTFHPPPESAVIRKEFYKTWVAEVAPEIRKHISIIFDYNLGRW